MSRENRPKWQMNAARALGNLGDRRYVPLLLRTFAENPDESVRCMCAWALGRLGGKEAVKGLEARLPGEEGPVKEEIQLALEKQ
ncbi:MAG: HEAT repeat domain-containing protein [Pseudomonadota bacterium]